MRKLLFLFLAVSLLACSDGDIPRDILPKRRMQAVLWDLLRAGEYLDVHVLSRDTTGIDKNAKMQEWYDQVFRLHRVTRAEFQKSYTYYQDHPVLMREVLDSLSKKPTPPIVSAKPASTPAADTIKGHKGDTLQGGNARLLRIADSAKRRKIIQQSLKSR